MWILHQPRKILKKIALKWIANVNKHITLIRAFGQSERQWNNWFADMKLSWLVMILSSGTARNILETYAIQSYLNFRYHNTNTSYKKQVNKKKMQRSPLIGCTFFSNPFQIYISLLTLCCSVQAELERLALGDSIPVRWLDRTKCCFYASLKNCNNIVISDSIALKLSHFTRNLSRNNTYVIM